MLLRRTLCTRPHAISSIPETTSAALTLAQEVLRTAARLPATLSLTQWVGRNPKPRSVVSSAALPKQSFRFARLPVGASCLRPSATAPSRQRLHRSRRRKAPLPCWQRHPLPYRFPRRSLSADAAPPEQEPGRTDRAASDTRRSAPSCALRSRLRREQPLRHRQCRNHRLRFREAPHVPGHHPVGSHQSPQHRTGESLPSSRPPPESTRCVRAGQPGLDRGQPPSVTKPSEIVVKKVRHHVART